MRTIVLLTPDDRRALLAALKPGLVYTRPTADPTTFTVAGVNVEFQLAKEDQQPNEKKTEFHVAIGDRQPSIQE